MNDLTSRFNNQGHDKTTVLLSGGVDSMACTHFYKVTNAYVDGLFIDYGQKAASREKKAASNIASYFDIRLSKIRLNGLSPFIYKSGFIRGRNVAFLIIGLMNSHTKTGSIALGVHSGTDYSDCTPEFEKLSQKIFDLYTGGKFSVGAPFISWSKADVWKYCETHKLPVDMTYSCELGLDQPCGICNSCKDRIVLSAG